VLKNRLGIPVFFMDRLFIYIILSVSLDMYETL